MSNGNPSKEPSCNCGAEQRRQRGDHAQCYSFCASKVGAPTSKPRLTPEKLAEFRELVQYGSHLGVGGRALALLLDEIEACWRERSAHETTEQHLHWCAVRIGKNCNCRSPIRPEEPSANWICEYTGPGGRCGRENHPLQETCWYCHHRRQPVETTALPESLRDPAKCIERGRGLLESWGPTPVTDAALAKTSESPLAKAIRTARGDFGPPTEPMHFAEKAITPTCETCGKPAKNIADGWAFLCGC